MRIYLVTADQDVQKALESRDVVEQGDAQEDPSEDNSGDSASIPEMETDSGDSASDMEVMSAQQQNQMMT